MTITMTPEQAAYNQEIAIANEKLLRVALEINRIERAYARNVEQHGQWFIDKENEEGVNQRNIDLAFCKADQIIEEFTSKRGTNGMKYCRTHLVRIHSLFAQI